MNGLPRDCCWDRGNHFVVAHRLGDSERLTGGGRECIDQLQVAKTLYVTTPRVV